MRIDTELSEDESDQVQNLADEQGLQKPKAYTDLIRTALPIQKRREKIKDYIVRFFEQAKPRHEERVQTLKAEYNIEDVSWVENCKRITHNGNIFDFNGDPSDMTMVNGESYRMSVCPECGSEDTKFNIEERKSDEVPNYTCQDCGEGFEKTEREYRVPQEEAEHVKEFSWAQYQLQGYVHGKLIDILDKTMTKYGGGRSEWLHPGTLSYSNGFQNITIPWFCTDRDRIHFNSGSDRSFPDFDGILNPLSPAGRRYFTEDYLQLVAETRAANPDADGVKPIFMDTRGSHPEIIEIRGLGIEAARLPYRKIGYELEILQPTEDDMKTEFKGEKVQIELDNDADDVTWIRITNDKRIERPQQYGDSEEFYLAISTESANPIHMIDRDSQKPFCGEDLPGITTNDRTDRLNGEPVSRRGICNDCLDEYEDF